jgi:hypothetical protein
MEVGASDVFDKAREYFQKNYPDLQGFAMPYCTLYQDNAIKKKYYRVQISYRRKGDMFDRSAILQANCETGVVEMFKEGFTWSYWVT